MTTNQYNKIHQKVCDKIWDNLDDWTRNQIASDVDHKSYVFRSFQKYVDGEATKLYEDPSYWYNNPNTFYASKNFNGR